MSASHPFQRIQERAGNALRDVIKDREIDLVIPTCEEVLHLGALWQCQPPEAKLFAPDMAALEQVHHKFHFIRLCDSLGLPTPHTHLITSKDALTLHSHDASEMVFKPVWSRFAADVLIRPKPHKLRHINPTSHTPWVAQEFVDGTEFCIYAIAREGQLTAFSAYRGLVRAGPGASVCFTPGLFRRFA